MLFSHEAALVGKKIRIRGSAENTNFKSIQDDDRRLRTTSLWVIINLTAVSAGAPGRALKFHTAGVLSRLKCLVNDPCLDVKVSYSGQRFPDLKNQ